MGGGPPGFPRGFTCPVVLRVRPGGTPVSATGLSPSMAGLSRPLRLPASLCHSMWDALQPRRNAVSCTAGLGSSPFARRYLGNRGCFLFLGVLRCFSSPGVPSVHPMDSGGGTGPRQTGGLPHSDIPGSTLCLRLPEAYRCLPRPSSAPGAKASTVCPYFASPQTAASGDAFSSRIQFSRCESVQHWWAKWIRTTDLTLIKACALTN